MTPPTALKLVRAPSSRSAPKPPFGLSGFADDAPALAIETDREDTLASIAERIPAASELSEGTAVVILGSAGRGRGLVAKLFGKNDPVPRALRASALLVRGYRDIAASVDEASGHDLVTGLA